MRFVIQSDKGSYAINFTDEEAAEVARGLSLAAKQAKDMLKPQEPGEESEWLVPYATLEDVGLASDGTVALQFVDENQVDFGVRIEATSARVLARMIDQNLPPEDIPDPDKAQ